MPDTLDAPKTAEEILLDGLNAAQREAVTQGMDPLLIVAGAGTGKTTTLTHRVAWLVHSGIDPKRILLLTFTRRAAAEMLSRVGSCLKRLEAAKPPGAPRLARAQQNAIWGGTFHAMSVHLLRQHGRLIGLEPDFTVVDRADAEDLLNVARQQLVKPAEGKRFPLKETCLSIYSRCVNAREPLQRVLTNQFPWCVEFEDELKKIFQAYVDRKEKLQMLDYDDLLLFWNALVSCEAGAATVRKQFDCVLVDEYQDTNILQSEILKNICPDGRGLTVVGDDAQSIYSFRAATVRNILDFPDEFPGTRIVKLEENYRSTQPILEATNRVIAESKERHEKNLFSQRTGGQRPQVVPCMDEDEQSDFIVNEVLAHREKGISLKRQAVLFRASHHSLSLEVVLTENNIPFHKYGGLKFTEASHIKDMLAFLRMAENPLDLVSATRVLLLLPGIGQKRAEEINFKLAETNGDLAALKSINPPKAAKDYWPEFVNLLQYLNRASRKRVAETNESLSLPVEIEAVRKFYDPLMELKYDNPTARSNDLAQLVQIAARYKDRAEFLTSIALDPPSSTQDLAGEPVLDDDFLILSTIHSAKGLEWDNVFVIHASDGNIPSDMATKDESQIEEERRLFYVALSRAKDHLYVCQPQRYYTRGRWRDEYTVPQLTRFLSMKARAAFDWRMPDQDEPITPKADGPALSVVIPAVNAHAQARKMWE